MSQGLSASGSGAPRATETDALPDALEALRRGMVAHIDETQGAFHRRSPVARLWPLLLAGGVCLALVAWGTARGMAVGLDASTAFGAVSACLALIAVGLAPASPGRAEHFARIALGIGVFAIGLEVVHALLATGEPIAASNVKCASFIAVLGLPPLLLAFVFLRRAATPARLLHVGALACGAFLTSGAVVWATCPGQLLSHVVLSHALAPVAVATALTLAVRPLLKGQSYRPPANQH